MFILRSILVFMAISCLIVSLNLSAKISAKVDGKGRFYAQEGDNLSFLKSQLLHAAFEDVLGQQLKEMGLDGALFWQKYQESFNQYFQPIEKNLRAKYKIDGTKPVSANTRKIFNTELRLKKLNLKKQHLRLSRAITSYTIKRMSRSPHDAKARYMNIEARVDRNILQAIYYQLVRPSENRSFKTIFIESNIRLLNLTWDEMGVEIERDFTKVLQEYWLRWSLENFKGIVKNVVIVDSDMARQLREFINSRVDLRPLGELKDAASIREGNQFYEGLYLKLRFNILKTSENKFFNRRGFSITGDVMAIDLSSKEIVSGVDLGPIKKQYPFQKAHDLSSHLAGLIYRAPLPAILSAKNELLKHPFHRVTRVDVHNLSSVKDLVDLLDGLTEKSAMLRTQWDIVSYQNGKAMVLFKYSGEEDSLIARIKELENKIRIDDRTFNLETRERPYILIFKVAKAEV